MRTKITQDTLLKLRAKMVKCAEVHKHPHAEDIASEYVVRLLNGLHAKASVEQAYIDIVRGISGRKGSVNYESRLSITSVATSEAQQAYMDNAENPLEDLSVDDWIDLKRYLMKVKCPKVAKVLALRLEGYNLQEIAIRLEVTESRISQILIREIDRLKDVL